MCRVRTGVTRRKQLNSKMKSIFCKQLYQERRAAIELAGMLEHMSKSAREAYEDEQWLDEPQKSALDNYDSDMDILSSEEEVEDEVSSDDDEYSNESSAQTSFAMLYVSYQRIVIRRRAAAGLPTEGIKFPPTPRIAVPAATVTPVRTNGVITELFDVSMAPGKTFEENGMNLMVDFWKRRINNKWKNQRIRAIERVKVMIDNIKNKNVDVKAQLEDLRERLIMIIVETMLLHKSLCAPEVSDALNDMMAFGTLLNRESEPV